MKVICINAKAKREGAWCQLEEGRIYEVTPVISHCGLPAYDIGSEFLPTKCTCGTVHESAFYARDRFIPLSNIDETERIDEVIETIFVEKDTKILENECLE